MLFDGMQILQWAGCGTGVLGAILLATKTKWSGYGFLLFLASSVFWMAYGVVTHTEGLITQQVVFTLTSLAGIWKWLVEPPLIRYWEDKGEEWSCGHYW